MPGRRTIATTALEFIESQGPQSLAALVDEIGSAGLTRARRPDLAVSGAIAHDPRFVAGPDERWYALGAQLSEAILVRSLSAFERRYDLIVLEGADFLVSRLLRLGAAVHTPGGSSVFTSYLQSVFDLPYDRTDGVDSYAMLDTDSALLAEGEQTINFLDGRRWGQVLASSPGWLDAVGDEDYLGLCVRGGSLELTGVRRDAIQSRHADEAAAFVRSFVRDSWDGKAPVPVDDLLTALLTERPDLLRCALPPLEVLVARAGMALTGSSIDPTGRVVLIDDDVATGQYDHYYDHMATRTTATDAKARLLALLDRVSSGEEIEITRHGRTVARLVPAAGSSALRGSLASIAATAADDLDLFSTGVEWEQT